ncbi:MAG: hypothetical protein H6Q07_1869, partial [Acidobacteria bacterium]|nr:hypothetical protein [Acidobacteriota bacterium]
KDFLFPDGEVLLMNGPAAAVKPVLSPLGVLKPLTPEF